MKKLIITLLVIAGIACLVLPKVLGTKGTQIHNQYFQDTAQQLMPGITVQSETMKDGWFNSEGQHRIKLTDDALGKLLPGVKGIDLDKDIDVIVNTKFHHGPIAFTSMGGKGGSFSPVLAVGESTFKIEADGKQIDIPGKLYTQVNATGSGGKARYSIESFSQKTEDAQIDFEGLDFDFDISKKGQALNGKGKTGKFSLVADNGGKMLFNGLKFNADVKDNGGLWLGDSSFSISELMLDDGRGQSFAIKDVNVYGGSDADEDTMKGDAKLTVGSFDVSGMTFKDFTFDYEMANIDTKSMRALQLASKPGANGMPDQAAMMESLKGLVARSPNLDINELSVVTPQGKVIADLHFGLPDEVDMGFFPLSLLPQIQGDANVRVPVAVIKFVSMMRPGLDQQAEMLSQMGMLEVDGDDYIAVFKMSEGSMTLNGNPVPLPGMF